MDGARSIFWTRFTQSLLVDMFLPHNVYTNECNSFRSHIILLSKEKLNIHWHLCLILTTHFFLKYEKYSMRRCQESMMHTMGGKMFLAKLHTSLSPHDVITHFRQAYNYPV